MNWLSILGSAVLLLSIHYGSVETSSLLSPWAEPTRARSFMNCLLSKIAGSNVLPIQEKEDLKSIMDTLMSAVNEANARGKTSGAQLKAINMAIASSLAEIVVAEDVGNQASIVVKTQALTGALEQCFQLVMGTIDRKFINEINDLISMFAKEAVSEDVVQNQGGFTADVSLTSSSFQTTSQSADNAYQSSEALQGSIKTTGGYTGSQVLLTPLPSLQASGQSSDNTYQSNENFQGSTKTVGGYRRGYSGPKSMQTSLSSFKTSQTSDNINQSAERFRELAKTGGGYRRYSDSQVLQPSLSPFQATSESSDSTYQSDETIKGSAKTTRGYRRGYFNSQVPQISLPSLQTTSQSFDNTYQSGETFRGSVKKTSGYRRGHSGPKVLQNIPIRVRPHISRSERIGLRPKISLKTSDSQTSGSSSTSFSQSIDSTQNGAVSTTLGADSNILSGTVASVDNDFVGGGKKTGLISRLSNELANSGIFKAAFRRGISQKTTNNIIRRTIQTLANTMSVDKNKLGRKALRAIYKIAPGSDTTAYAQALSNALVTSGILNERNIDSVGPSVMAAVLNGISSAVTDLDINVDSANVQKGIQSTSSLVTTNASTNSFSQSGDSITASVAKTAGGSPIGTLGGPVPQTTKSPNSQGAQTGLISRMTNALVNSPTFRALLRRGVVPQTASNLMQRIVQSLTNKFAVNRNNFGRMVLQSIAQIAPDSDTPLYAQALSTALVNGGILNESNLDTVGPQVLTAVLNALSKAGQDVGLNGDSGNSLSEKGSSLDYQAASFSSTRFSQSSGSSTNDATSMTVDYPVRTLDGPVTPTGDPAVRRGSQAEIISRVTNALVNSPKFRAFLRRGVTPQTTFTLMQKTVQSLANTFGVDGNNFGRMAIQGISQLSPSSDTPVYAQLFSTALVNGGILNESNIDTVGPQVISAILNALSNVGQDLSIKIDNYNAQSYTQSNIDSQTTSSLSTSFSQSEGSKTIGVSSTTGGYPIGALGGPVSQTIDSPTRGSAQTKLISRVSNALVNSPAFRTSLKRGIPSQTAYNFIQKTVQSLANNFGIDGNNFGSIAIQGISQLSPSSDTTSYAQILATAFVNGGILNESNIDSMGSQVLSIILNGLSTTGQGVGINVNNDNVQNDQQSGSAFQKTSSSSTSFTQSDRTTLSTNTNPALTLEGSVPQTIISTVNGGRQTELVPRVVNALVNSPTFRSVFKRGVPSQTASNLIQRTAQSLANTLGVDGNNFGRIAMQGISQLSSRSDANSYAQILATALVEGGILNESNMKTSGPQVISAVMNALSSAGQGLVLDLDSGNLLNEKESSSDYQATSSSSTSFSKTDSSISTTNTIPVVTLGGPVPQTIGSSVTGSPQTGLISRVANALVNSPTFRTSLRRGVPSQLISNLIQRTAQSLANTFGIDGNNFGRIAIQGISQLSPRSDVNSYAQILATALVNGGILNESNIDSVGSRVLSAVLSGLSSVGQGLDINMGDDNSRNDVQSNIGFQRTSSSSKSFSHSDSSSTNKDASSTNVSSGGNVIGSSGGPYKSTVDSSGKNGSQAGLIARVANVLVNSPRFRDFLRKGVPLQISSNLIQRTVQSLANTFGVDGNKLGRIAVQAIGQLSPDSETPSYAQALSTVLVNGGILNESNINTVGSQVLSAIFNGLSSAGQWLGANISNENVENDTQSDMSYMRTSSSTGLLKTDGNISTGSMRASGYSPGTKPSVGGQQSEAYAHQGYLVQSSSNQGDFSQSSNFASSVTNQDLSGTVLTGGVPSLETSMLPSLDSPIGLRSGPAEARISQLASSILNSISPIGVDANIMARSLQASVTNLRRSGMSPRDAKIEVLLETIVGLLQLLSNAQVRGLNSATASAVTSSAARSFELALAK